MNRDINFEIDGLVQGNNGSILPINVLKKGTVENIDGAIVRVAIKHGDSLITKRAEITDAANGKCEITLTREDLTGSGWYFYQPTITFPDDREFTGGIDRFSVSGKLSGQVPAPVPNGIDLSRLSISSSGRLTIDGVEQIGDSDGGSVPSNVILFEDWTEGESVTIDTGTATPPADTTAPVLTITSGGTFTGTKSVTMSTNETAEVYYTLDGSTPSTNSSKYTTTLSLNATTTLKAFAKDTAGNTSAVQTVTYTLEEAQNPEPTDTTAPVLTMTTGGTFTDTQTINMSVDETADIWYTVDGSDPVTSGTRVTYSAPVTLTATTTVKAYAVDTAGNASGVQSVTYTKLAAYTPGPNRLLLNGSSDSIKLPLGVNINAIELDVNIKAKKADGTTDNSGYLLDMRNDPALYPTQGYGINNAFILSGFNVGSGIATFLINGVEGTDRTTHWSNIPKDQRSLLKYITTAVFKSVGNIAKRADGYNEQFMRMELYGIKLYNGNTLVASYDFTYQFAGTQITDQSGNNNHATLTGGTWL